ncbi:MAG: flavin reductase family protein [Planctomycetota bacterium]
MHRELNAEAAQRLCATRPIVLVTTQHATGVVNGGAFGAWTNLGSLQVGIAVGKPTHTYHNIRRVGEFVINIPDRALADAVEVFGQDVPEELSELDEAGLSTAPSKHVAVPRIAECVAAIECRFLKELEIGYHSFVVGRILGGSVREDLVDDEGYFDVLKAQVLHGYKYPKPFYLLFGDIVEAKQNPSSS